MIENRYHIISLAAVFLALGLGILIGSSIVGVNIIDSVAEKQGIMLGSLEQDYLLLREEIYDLRRQTLNKQQEIDNVNNLLEQLKVQIISDKLQGKKIGLIEIEAQQSSINKLQDLLQLSKAQILFKTTLHQKIFEKSKEEIINLIAKDTIMDEIINKDILNCSGLTSNHIDAFIFITNDNFTNNFIEMINLLQEQFPVYIVKEGKKTNQGLTSIFSMENVKEEILFILELANN